MWKSWTLKKARDYRKVNDIPEDLGTAVNIVAMVFGNLGDDSGTGVAFTRDPSTGERKFYGEFLVNAQGEDVVAGIRTPLDIDEMAERLPDAYEELLETQDRLEKHYSRHAGPRVHRRARETLPAADAYRKAHGSRRRAHRAGHGHEGLIDRTEAVNRVSRRRSSTSYCIRSSIPRSAPSPSASGCRRVRVRRAVVAVFDPDTAEQRHAAGDAVILVRDETTPEDFHGIVAARAVLTARGGMTSHAAVVARGMGKCAIVGCKDIEVDLDHRTLLASTARRYPKATG